ncbi:MAG TPA: sigma-54 dependent transcriptional regulator [Polyangiaceae bacterium]|nr:sigma-54 dependent transcriptional regulator [Polyangiaceae bacterium]
MRRARVLLVDDEPTILTTLRKALTLEGHDVEVAGGARLAIEKARKDSFDAAVLDVNLPDGNGVELLAELRALDPDLCCLMMSGQATIDTAVRATQLGARDFLEKPVSTDRLLLSLENGLSLRRAEHEAAELREQAGVVSELHGQSPTMVRLRELVARAARSPASVLVTGERGTGKELVARAIHDASPRRQGPLEKLNCAAVPENLIESELFGHEVGAFSGATKRRIGKFERAQRGTLFLDEVGDMPTAMQAKLLRVLQEQELERVGGSESIRLDVRVVAATNKDLRAACREGTFRADLLDRLDVVPIALPPLRQHPEDIAELAQRFLAWASKRNDRPGIRLAPDAELALGRYSFPGNVRELRNLVERLVILTLDDTIHASDVGACLSGATSERTRDPLYEPGVPFRVLAEQSERRILEEALAAHGGQMAATARALGLERSHLYKKAKALGLRGAEGNGMEANGEDEA